MLFGLEQRYHKQSTLEKPTAPYGLGAGNGAK
jgi:hypothetical protein